jgi:adhesin/invasin
VTPTFSASGSNNSYGICSATNLSGASTCTLSSTTAETKTLSLLTPVSKADGTVVFTSAAASAANSSISGTTPVLADGAATSTITITLKDTSNNPVSGQTPTFSATDTGTKNAYGDCSATDASGIATCTLSSFVAETKVLSIDTPVIKAGASVVFTAGTAVAENSTITGTTLVVADDIATSTITVTLKDLNNNVVSGLTPTFSATDTGGKNTYSDCSVSNTLGVSTCTLTSKKAESKTLSIVTPVLKADGTVLFVAGSPSALTTTIAGTTPVSADGLSTSAISVTLYDEFSNPISGVSPIFNATGLSNSYGDCSVSNASGLSVCTLASTTAEVKTLQLTSPVAVTGNAVTFSSTSAVAANSTITGTSPVVANGTSTSTVTITLKDLFNNPVAGQTPTFSATDTGTTNENSLCSVTDSFGVSTCTLSSKKAETKTLSIDTPVVKADGNVIFTADVAVAANSSITGTSSVIATGLRLRPLP